MKKFYFLPLLILTILSSAIFGVSKVEATNEGFTNLCGTGTNATSYICPAACDLNSKSCTGAAVARFECDGRQTDCRSNESWGISQSVGNPGCGKTVQIDVFSKNCRDGAGNWTCNGLPSFDPAADLKGYITYYTGDCVASNPVTPVTSVPVCNENAINLTASPSILNPNQQVNFAISGDASTFVNDNVTGGVTGCFGPWDSKTCTALNTPGTFTWTHQWKHCEGSINNCSTTCSKSVNFTIATPALTPTPIQSGPTLTPVPTATVVPTATPAPAQNQNLTQNVRCPDGTNPIIRNSNIICIQQQQSQQQNQTATGGNAWANASTGPININVARTTPQVITVPAQTQPVVIQAAAAPQVAALPKTGLPLGAWALTGLIPMGIKLKGFGLSKSATGNIAQMLWQQRQFFK